MAAMRASEPMISERSFMRLCNTSRRCRALAEVRMARRESMVI